MTIKPVVLVSGAHVQNRGSSGKDRFYTRVECNYSGIVGNLSANIIGQVAVSESIDLIRERWSQGKTASGDPYMIGGEGWTKEEGIEFYTSRRPTTHRRFIWQGVLEHGPGPKSMPVYQRNPTTGVVYLTHWDVSGDWYKDAQALYTMRRVFTNTIDGMKARTRLKATFVPNYTAPAFASSGLMIASLRGAVERKRSYMLPTTASRRAPVRVDVEAGFSLQVDPKRSGCAVALAGLNEVDMGDVVNRQTCPKTAAMVDNLIELHDTQAAIKEMVETMRLVAQGMRWIGAL